MPRVPYANIENWLARRDWRPVERALGFPVPEAFRRFFEDAALLRARDVAITDEAGQPWRLRAFTAPDGDPMDLDWLPAPRYSFCLAIVADGGAVYVRLDPATRSAGPVDGVRVPGGTPERIASTLEDFAARVAPAASRPDA